MQTVPEKGTLTEEKRCSDAWMKVMTVQLKCCSSWMRTLDSWFSGAITLKNHWNCSSDSLGDRAEYEI